MSKVFDFEKWYNDSFVEHLDAEDYKNGYQWLTCKTRKYNNKLALLGFTDTDKENLDNSDLPSGTKSAILLEIKKFQQSEKAKLNQSTYHSTDICRFSNPDMESVVSELDTMKVSSPMLRMKFNVNGSFRSGDERRYFMVNVHESNSLLYEMIKDGKFITLCGPRASGKSTRMEQSTNFLRKLNLLVFKITLQGICTDSTKSSDFWNNIGHLLTPYFTISINLQSAADFMQLFRVHHGEQKKRIVLYIDEFDVLRSNNTILTDLLDALRGIKSSITSYHLHSVVIIGVVGIHHLNTTDRNRSPFNTTEILVVPNLQLDGIRDMFNTFSQCRNCTIDDEVIQNVFEVTNGHAGLVSMCGREIETHCLNGKTELDLAKWKRHYNTNLHDWLLQFPTMQRLLQDLREDHNLQRYILQYAIGSNVIIRETGALGEHYDALLSLGVTSEITLDTGTIHFGRSQISSPLLRTILLLYLEYHDVKPKISADILYSNGHLNIKDIIVHALLLIPVEDIKLAIRKMFKKCGQQFVPHEYFYHAHMIMILRQSLNQLEYSISMEAKSKDNLKRVDIMIARRDERGEEELDPEGRYIIELMATDTAEKSQRDHIDKSVHYGSMFNSKHMWMIHVVCCDDPLKFCTHERATENQNVHVLLAIHGSDGKWIRFSYASMDNTQEWQSLPIPSILGGQLS